MISVASNLVAQCLHDNTSIVPLQAGDGKIGAVVGSMVDAETLISVKDFVNRLGSELLCTEEDFPMGGARQVSIALICEFNFTRYFAKTCISNNIIFISNHWYATKKVATLIGFGTIKEKSKMCYVALLAYRIKK